VLIGLIGGILGCLVGSLCDGLTANSIISGGAGGGKFVVLKLTVDAQILAVGLLLTLLAGPLHAFTERAAADLQQRDPYITSVLPEEVRR